MPKIISPIQMTKRNKYISYKDGIKVKEYNSLIEAAQDMNKLGFSKSISGARSSISQVTQGIKKQAYGFSWEKVEK